MENTDAKSTGNKPGGIDIFDYTDHREYLRDALEPFKGARSGMSMRGIAKRAGIRSSATLTLILKGERVLTPQVASKLGKVLKLEGRRLRYLKTLSELSAAQSIEERTAIKEELVRIKSFAQAQKLDLKQYRFWSHWYYVAIYALLGLEQWADDFKGIALRLGRGITPKQVEEALNDMVELELIEQTAQNGSAPVWIQKQGPILKSTEDVINFALQRFHKEVLELAKEALDVPVELREITSLTTSIPVKALPEIKEKIRQFREDLDQYIGRLPNHDEVYQFNFQLFPLTKVRSGKGVWGKGKGARE